MPEVASIQSQSDMAIEVSLAVNAPVSTVWAALTDPVVLERWYGSIVPCFRTGGTAQLDFGDGEFLGLENIRVEVPHLLQFDYRLMGFGVPTEITWRVDTADTGSRVTVIERPSGGLGHQEARARGWLGFLQQLQRFVHAEYPG